MFIVAGAGLATGAIAAVLLYPLFAATMMRWWISGLRFGAVTVRSQLATAQVYRIYLRFLRYIVPFVLGVLAVGGLAVVSTGALVGSNRNSILVELLAGTVTLASYVVIVLGASTIYQVTVSFAMWRAAAQSAELSGADALDGVRAGGAPDSALGEGLADALGVGGI